MGNNCRVCSETNQDKEMEIQSNQHPTTCHSFEELQQDSIDNNLLKLSHNIDPSKWSSRGSKLGIVIPVQICQKFDDNVNISKQRISENHKLVVKSTLKKHFIFSQLLEGQLEILIQKVAICSAQTDTYIFREGDKARSYYIILEGQCSIEINNQFKKKIKIGDSFGDLAIIYKTNRTASIKTLKKCIFGMVTLDIMDEVLQEINNSEEKDNLQLLQQAEVFKNFSSQFKSAIAANCLTQVYQEGQIVVNQGDSANSMYIIKKGILHIVDKNVEIGPKVCFGETCLIGGGSRSNTIICKTKAELISINSSALNQILDSNGKNTLMTKLVQKIIKDSNIFLKRPYVQIQQLIKLVQIIPYKSGDIVIPSSTKPQNGIYVTLGSSLQNTEANQKVKPNTVLKATELANQQQFLFENPLYAQKDGFIAKINMISSRKRRQVLLKKKKSKPQEKQKSSEQQKMMQLSDLFYIKNLRSGNFGKVVICYYPTNKKLYAVKIIDIKKTQAQKLMHYVENQQSILRQIEPHPFIINFHKLVQDSHNFYLIMDYANGEDLFDFLTRISVINYSNIPFYLSQLVLALEHIHNQKIVFRDLKPQNVILNSDGYLVLVDFGSAKKLNLEKKYRTKTIIGTPHYMAPQVILGRGYSFNVDLWALGIMLYQMMFCKLPFGENCDDPFQIYEEVIRTRDIFFPKKCKDDARDLLQRLLNKKPEKRCSFTQIKQHQLLRDIEWNKILNKKEIAPYLPISELPSDKQPLIKKITSKQKNKLVEKMRKVLFRLSKENKQNFVK